MQEFAKILSTRKANILDLGHRQSAVLLPLIETKAGLSLLFEVRSSNLRGQPGDVCFPGGLIENTDANPQAAAVRETAEELGIPAAAIEVFGPLDIYVSPHNLVLHPFVGQIPADLALNPAPQEVAEVFAVPLDYLLNTEPRTEEVGLQYVRDADFPYHLITRGKDYGWSSSRQPIYFYKYEDWVIWGLTAIILHHFLQVIR